MNNRFNLTYTIPLCLCVGLTLSARATITGQWDFKAGNYDATIGQPIFPLDTPTATGTQFGSTTTFGISAIGGTPTNVMQFPKAPDEFGGYGVPVGASANGGGNYVNQYTIILDVLFTNAPAAGKTFTLFHTDLDLDLGSGGGEFFINSSSAIGYSGGGTAGGNVTPNAWHRIAIAVDLTNAASGLSIGIDGTIVVQDAPAPAGLDSNFAISSSVTLFDDQNTNSETGYIASLQFNDLRLPDGLITALGAPVATGILMGPPPSPWIVSLAPQNDLRFPARSTIPPAPLIQIVLNDGTATVRTNTILLKINGSNVPPIVTYAAPTTTITYQVPATNFLAAGSRNSVVLTYQDSTGDALGTQWQFDVGSFIALPAAAAAPLGSASTPGFIYRVAQAPADATLDNSLTRALQQLDGTLLNPTNGLPFGNEADFTQPGSQGNGTYFVDQYDGPPGTVSFSTVLGFPAVLPDFTAYAFPGIPGTNGSTYNFASDVLAYLPLNAGTYVFGVAVGANRVDTPPDNGYELFCGVNPRDRFSTLVGQYVRTAPAFNSQANTNTFTFVAPVSGVYPFRLVHWQNGATFTPQADLAWYYVDPVSGNNVLINDPASSITAYRVSTIQREPYMAEVYPAPGGQGFAPTDPIKVILSDDNLHVGAGSITLYLNGVQVTPSIGKTNSLTTVLYNPNASRTTVTNNVQLVYSDDATPAAHRFTNNWAFTITVSGGGNVPAITGQWDFNNGDLTATVGKDLQYFDGPSGTTHALTQFGTCSSLGLPLIHGVDARIMKVPGGTGVNGNNNFGYIMDHQIAPNGGGTLVNQYTIIWDMYYPGSGVIPFFNCQNTNNAPADGSLFLQNGQMGQGSGGYAMPGLPGGAITAGWHRLAFAVDLAQNLITKWVDGKKAQDWTGQSLDAPRRAWQQTVLLFADGDGDDHDATVYVKSVQVRNGKLSDAEMAALGGPTGDAIPQTIPATSVTGQWDFLVGNLMATVGKDLQYFDGAGSTSNLTQFGTCSALGVPLINGVDAPIMKVPGGTGVNGNNNFGYIMDHQIAPNGGGTLVNQYTIIWDMYYPGSGTIPFFNCQNTNNAPADGSLFLQNGQMGQGSGGYVMLANIGAGWHRLAFAVDLSQGLITKWVDGVKQQDWTGQSLDAPRRAWQHTVLLFADCDGDDHDQTVYVRSIQVSAGKLGDAAMVALGKPDGNPIPAAAPATFVTGQWDFNVGNLMSTVGKDLQYLDGAGSTSNLTQFGTCSSFGLPMINGADAQIIKVPGGTGVNGNNNFGYIMDHQIAPNGGGTLVNQYTIIWDMYYPGSGTIPFFNCQNTNNAPADGSLFLQNGQMGQGSGGYVMLANIGAGWHRLAFAVDLPQGLITKWVDGVKQQDWTGQSLDAPRRAWQHTVLLFADGDGDDHDQTVYVDSIQVSVGKRSDAYMEALGGPSGTGIPVYVAVAQAQPPQFNPPVFSNGQLTITWTGTATLLESTNVALPMSQWTPVPGSPSSSFTVNPTTNGALRVFYRLQQ
jgi:hypothetical protein